MECRDEIEKILIEIIDIVFEKVSAGSIILDFSSSFKPKKKLKRIPRVILQPKEEILPELPSEPAETIEIELPEIIEIPEKLISLPEEMYSRKYMDIKR